MDEERKETKHEANDDMTLCNEKSWSFAFLTKLLCYAMVHMQYRSRLVQVLVLREISGADDIAVKCKSNTPEFGTKTCSARFVVIPRSAICSLYHKRRLIVVGNYLWEIASHSKLIPLDSLQWFFFSSDSGRVYRTMKGLSSRTTGRKKISHLSE